MRKTSVKNLIKLSLKEGFKISEETAKVCLDWCYNGNWSVEIQKDKIVRNDEECSEEEFEEFSAMEFFKYWGDYFDNRPDFDDLSNEIKNTLNEIKQL